MKEKYETFDELITHVDDYLRNKLLRNDRTLQNYYVYWRGLKKYMDSQHIERFGPEVSKDYLLQQFGNRDFSTLSKREKRLIRCVNLLCEFQETGSIQHVHAAKEPTIFEGPIGQLMTGYLSYKISLRLTKDTITEHERHLYRFLCYLQKNEIGCITTINHLHILNYVKEMDARFATQTHDTLQSLRAFFRYLYEQRLVDVDIAEKIPKDNYKRQPKLPSTYKPKEIEMMIASIDRANALGKRNYAIVLLAARLGLRASDIAGLTFENLHWEQSMIVLDQYKTGRELQLPMLTDVGEAIIDYLKYGRPESKEPNVFLQCRSPFMRIYSHSITCVVHHSFVRAGVNIENRRHGPHSLRHSLAGILLEKGTVLPVISEVLGHEYTSSTEYYLRIDLKSMRQCALSVPLVSTSFYNQKGGYFYA